MLYRNDNMAAYAMSFPAEDKPGEHFRYSSGTSNILSYIIKQHTGNGYYQFASEQLFRKLGMLSAILEPDASGTFVGSSYCYATARDWARFGLLYLNDGILNGERILPEGWVKYTRTPAQSAKHGEYGAQFWLNAGEPGNDKNRTYPDVPTDCFFAEGFQGQEVWIIPSKKLVIVRLSLQDRDKLDENRFIADIIEAIK
jgi:CubicO group peptidase (beta-lactamase class C family)